MTTKATLVSIAALLLTSSTVAMVGVYTGQLDSSWLRPWIGLPLAAALLVAAAWVAFSRRETK